MNEEITASYTFNADALLPAYRWHQRRKLRLRLSVFLVICVTAFIYGLSSSREVPISIYIVGGVAALLVGLLIWMASQYANRFFWKRRINAMPVCGKEVKWIADKDTVRCFLSGADSNIQWNLFYESVQTPAGTLLYPQRNLFYWLPKTAFASEADYSRFLDLLAAKTKYSVIS